MKYRFFPGYSLAALLLLALAPLAARAQTTTGSVGIGTTAPDASAALDIVSSAKGVLLPRVAAATAIASPAPGLLVYQTNAPAGFYYNAGTAAAPSWQRLATASSSSGDNLGNHTATQALNLNGQKLTGGGPNGLRVRPSGGVAVDTLAGTGQGRLLMVAPDGTLQASAPIQDQVLATTPPDPRPVGAAATGMSPYAVAVNGAGTRAYVVNLTDNTLQAFGVSVSGVPQSLGTAATGTFPYALAVNGAGTRAYVVSFSSRTLQAYDVSGSGAPVALGSPVATGSSPVSVAVNSTGTRAYVANNGDNTLQAYDLSGGAPVALGSPAAIDASPTSVVLNGAGTRAYVLSGSRTLRAYDLSGGGVPVPLGIAAATGFGPSSLAVNSAGTRAYVVHYYDNTLQAYDLSGGSTPVALGSPVATEASPYSVALNGAGTRAYVACYSDKSFQAYDVSGSGAPVAQGNSVATGVSPRSVAVNGPGTRAFLVNQGSNTLQVYRLGAEPTVVGIDSDGGLGTFGLGQLADNLGNHTATQPLNLQGQPLLGTGASIAGVGVGVRADGGLNLGQNTTGNNVALGYQAGRSFTTGTRNTLVGYQAGQALTTGTNNTILGNGAGPALTTGANNTLLGTGASASASVSNATALGYQATANLNNSVVLGATDAGTGRTNSAYVGINVSDPTQRLDFRNGHLRNRQDVLPIAAIVTAAGITSVSVQAGGSDVRGRLTTTGLNNAGAYTQIRVSFSYACTNAPTVTITPANADAALTRYYVTTDANGFNFYFQAAAGPTAPAAFNYMVIE